ncbi:MAG: tetratricopeptide repeat protein [Bacteroidetes bacterium]|nr:MAG: tetratricopeptide repeat protein [Bacteroidota bacterium]
MSSIIQGYEYDIFISYRQKDNKGDRWVSEFVDALKTELESTFKEEISVYFDINPHDGLLETHDVNASLKEKLKCLVFIPIISQTYCDSKSFAWQNELVPFNKMAKEDLFGRDIRLTGGNVASRILLVKIHVLDPEDKLLLENELGGVLRGIEFIYTSSGVNRPLRPTDNPEKNLNKTYYRDQINKVANAVKEIITAIKKHNQEDGEISKEEIKLKPEKQKNFKSKIIIISAIILTLIIMGYFLIPKLSKSSASTEKSIAVLPFRNLSNDSLQTYFCDGFMEEILNNLQRVGEFTVRSRTSTDQYRKTAKTIRTIGEEMNVNYIIEGSVGRENNNLKIWIQLINAKTDKHVWANDYTREMKQIFSLQSEIAKDIASELQTILSPEESKLIDKKPTENLEAYNYYLLGNDYYLRSFDKQNFEIAAKMYEKAIALDPNFALAYVRLSLCYSALHWFHYDKNLNRLAKSKEYIDAAFKIDPDLPEAHLALATYYYWGFLNYSKALEEIKITEEKLKNNSECIYIKASIYRRAGEWSLAKENYLKAFVLDPGTPRIVLDLAGTLYLIGEYQEAEKYFNKVISINPALFQAYWLKSLNYMKWKGNTTQARETITEAFQFKECISNPVLFELNILIDIYDGNYQKALSNLSLNSIDIIEGQYKTNTKSLLYARIFSLLNMPENTFKYYDSARIILESRILKNPDDDRLYTAVGFAYAGLGLKEKAVDSGKRAVELMPINKEFYRGVYRIEDLARIYVMVGEYDAALAQIKLLLSLPGPLSTKLLLLDPAWKPLWNLPEFKKIIKIASPDVSGIQ